MWPYKAIELHDSDFFHYLLQFSPDLLYFQDLIIQTFFYAQQQAEREEKHMEQGVSEFRGKLRGNYKEDFNIEFPLWLSALADKQAFKEHIEQRIDATESRLTTLNVQQKKHDRDISQCVNKNYSKYTKEFKCTHSLKNGLKWNSWEGMRLKDQIDGEIIVQEASCKQEYLSFCKENSDESETNKCFSIMQSQEEITYVNACIKPIKDTLFGKHYTKNSVTEIESCAKNSAKKSLDCMKFDKAYLSKIGRSISQKEEGVLKEQKRLKNLLDIVNNKI